MSRQDFAQSGFTLIEVLAGLVVLGFVLAGLAQGTAFGLTAWGTQTRMISEHRDLDTIDRTLRRLIEQMDPGNQSRAPFLTATHDTLSFTTNLPSDGQNAGRLVDVGLGVDAAHRLTMRWSPHRHGLLLRQPQPAEVVLLDGVDHMDILYWSRTDQGGGGQTAWSGSDLPNLIRISLVMVKGLPQKWPPILVSPMREAPED